MGQSNKRQRRKFSDDFKRDAVDLVRTPDASPAERRRRANRHLLRTCVQ